MRPKSQAPKLTPRHLVILLVVCLAALALGYWIGLNL